MEWTKSAEERLKGSKIFLAFFVRPAARKKIEKFAQENGFTQITEEVYAQAKQKFNRSNLWRDRPWGWWRFAIFAINSLHDRGDPGKDRIVQNASLICCLMAQGIMVERPLFVVIPNPVILD